MEPVTIINTIMTALCGVDAASNIIKKLKGQKNIDQNDFYEIHNTILEIKSNILQSKIEGLKILEENEAIKKQNRQIKQWSIDKNNYEITTVSPGVQVYIKNGGNRYDIWYCPRCFDKNQKLSTIGLSDISTFGDNSSFTYDCTCCNFDFVITPQIHSAKVEYFNKMNS